MPIVMRLIDDNTLVVSYGPKDKLNAFQIASLANGHIKKFVVQNPDSSFTPFNQGAVLFKVLPNANRKQLNDAIEAFNLQMQKSRSLTLFDHFKAALPKKSSVEKENAVDPKQSTDGSVKRRGKKA